MALDRAWRHTGKVDVDAFAEEELHHVLVPSGSREVLRGRRRSHHKLVELISVKCQWQRHSARTRGVRPS
jgi:hypothetical protein